MKAVAYIRANARPDDLIVGSHELGFALGFQSHFLDDYRLGLATLQRPDYIVVEEIYRGRFDMLRDQRPEEYVQLQQLLKRHRTVYDRNNYQILEREDRQEAPAGQSQR